MADDENKQGEQKDSRPFVLCRRDISEIGQPRQYCGKPITEKNRLNWCNDCRRNLPLWP